MKTCQQTFTGFSVLDADAVYQLNHREIKIVGISLDADEETFSIKIECEYKVMQEVIKSYADRHLL